MLNSKLITILSTFSEEEMKDFEKFSSTFFTTGRNVDAFLKLLKKAHPLFSEKEIKKEIVFKKLYPGKDYNDKMMTAQIVSLTKAVEDYLIYRHLQNNKELREQVLLKEFLERKLFKYFASAFDDLENKIIKKDLLPSAKFNMLTELYSDASHYYANLDDFKGATENLTRYVNTFIPMVLHSTFFVSKINKIYDKFYNLKAPSNLLPGFLDSLDIDKFLSEIKDPALLPIRKSLELYYFVYIAFIKHEEDPDSDIKNIEKGMKIFKELRPSLNIEEKKHFYNDLSNIYLQIYNSGKMEVKPAIFQIFRSMLEDGIYNSLGGKYFDTNMFRSISMGAGDDPEWVEEVVEKYSHLLKEDIRDAYVEFAKAHICIARNKFEEALEHVGRITYASFLFKTDVKILTLILYYEMNYYEEALSVIDTYKHYIANTKDLSPLFKEVFGNFTMIVLKLYKLRENYSKNEADYLRHLTKNTKLPGYDGWIYRKIDELGK